MSIGFQYPNVIEHIFQYNIDTYIPKEQYNIQSTSEKRSDKVRWRDSLQTTWPILPQIVKAINSKESLRKFQDQGSLNRYQGSMYCDIPMVS